MYRFKFKSTSTVEVEQGFSILTSCGQDAVFLVLAGKAAKEGVLILEIKRALTELKPALL